MNVAVIGVGNMGRHHARVYSELSGVKLIAVCDINKIAGEQIAKKYHTKYYDNFLEMFKKEKVEAVSICVPTSAHFIVAKKCLSIKKHILLEKPITKSVREGNELLLLAKKQKVSLLVGHIERHNPAVKEAKEMIDKKELGEIIAIMTRRVGGFPPQIHDVNIAVDLAIHDIDIVNFFLDGLPNEISVNKQRYLIQNHEDAVEFFLKYKKASAYIQANWISPVKIRKLNITGTKGYLELDYITQKIDFYKSNYSKLKSTSKNFSDYILSFSNPDRINVPVLKKEPLREELLYFVTNIASGKLIYSDFALEALKIALHT